MTSAFQLPGRTTCDSPPTDSHSCSDRVRKRPPGRAPRRSGRSAPRWGSRRARRASPSANAATSAAMSAVTSPTVDTPRSAWSAPNDRSPIISPSSTAIIQSGRLVPVGGHLLGERGDASLEVRRRAGLLAVRRRGEDDVGMLGGLAGERVDRQDPTGAGDRPPSEIGIGAVVERIGTEQHEQLDASLGGSRECRHRVVVGVARRETERQRTHDVAATQRRKHLGSRHGRRGASAARRPWLRPTRRGSRGRPPRRRRRTRSGPTMSASASALATASRWAPGS